MLSANYGHINVLEWFHNSQYEFKYSQYAIDWTAKYGHINVLEWFRNAKYGFKYSKNAINGKFLYLGYILLMGAF